ncbi:hypothetical protein Tco_0985126, partial [Tanacetum coccineum]
VILFSIHNDEWKSFQCHHQTALRSYALSWKPCQGDSLNLPDHRIHKDGDGDASFQLKSDSLPHAHAQTTKTYYKHQDSRIMKAQELKTKTSAQTLIYKIFLQRYQVYQGRLLASFQDDAKYEHVGQDTRSQGGKDDQDKQGKDLKISDIKTKSKDNDKGSRSKITKHEGTSLQRIQRPRPQDLNDKSNLIDLIKECHNELTSGEIVSLKILRIELSLVAGIATGALVKGGSRSEVPAQVEGAAYRRHYLQCPQGLLGKHFEKLIKCDPHLNFLSQQAEVKLESPYFEPMTSVFDEPNETNEYDLSREAQPGIFDLHRTSPYSSSRSKLHDPMVD